MERPLQPAAKALSVTDEGRVPLPPTATTAKMTLAQFGQAVKARFPVYETQDDEELAKKVLEKYPVYAEKIAAPEEQPGFWKGLGRAIVEPFARIGASAKMVLGGGLEKDATTDEYGYDAEGNYVGVMRAKGVDLPALGNFKPVGYDEAGRMKSGTGLAADVLGNSIQAGMTFAPATKGAAVGEKIVAGTVGRLAPKYAATAVNYGKKLLPRAVESAGMGMGFQLGSNLSKERPLAENMGTALAFGAALPVAGNVIGAAGRKAAKATTKLRSGVAERMVNSLIKPLGKDFAYGKNPGRGVAAEGITANSLDEFAQKISQRRKEVGEAKGAFLAQEKYGGVGVDTTDALAPIEKALEEAKRTPNTNAALITRLEAVKADMEGLGVGGIQDLVSTDKLKQEIGQLAKWTGNASDDKLINKAVQQAYGTLKGKIETVAPEIRQLNERFGDLLSAEIAARYRDVVQQRLNLVSLGGRLTGIGGAIATVIATGGSAFPAILAGAGMGAIQEALGKPFVKTRVAAWLAKAGREEKSQVFNRVPALKNAIERVFGTTDAQSPDFKWPKLEPKSKIIEDMKGTGFDPKAFETANGDIDREALKKWMDANDFKGVFADVERGIAPKPEAAPLPAEFNPNSVERAVTVNAFPDEAMENGYQVYKSLANKYKDFDVLDEEGIYKKFKGTKRMAEYQVMLNDPIAGGGQYGLTADQLLDKYRARFNRERNKTAVQMPDGLPF